MTLQSGDPRSLYDYKPGWTESLGPLHFRLFIPPDETRYRLALAAEPEAGAFARAVEEMLR